MEESLIGLKTQLDQQSAMLKEVRETLKEIKDENAALRKFLGFAIRSAAASSDSNSLLDSISSVNGCIQNMSLPSCVCFQRETEEYIAKEIRSKTIDEERSWLKSKFNELKLLQKDTKDVPLLFNKSIEEISGSLRGASCAVKFTNYLSYQLSSPLYYVSSHCHKTRLPSWIEGGHNEVAIFEHDYILTYQTSLYVCNFVCSFEIPTTSLRITIFCDCRTTGYATLGLGFASAKIPVDAALYNSLGQQILPYDWAVTNVSKGEIELFLNHGRYFAKAQTAKGPPLIVRVEILEASAEDRIGSVFNPISAKATSDIANLDKRIARLVSFSDALACVVEIANGLKVSMKVRGYRPTEIFGASTEVASMAVETFCATDITSIEAVTAYEIEGSDLGLLVAVKMTENENTFAVVFLQASHFMLDVDLDNLLDQNKWNYLLKTKFASAKDGEQMIQTRNIRVTISMTEGQKSQVKVRIYTV